MKINFLILLLLLLAANAVAGQTPRREPTSAAGYISRGNSRWRNGNLQGAIVDYTKAIELDPNSADAYYGRGAIRQAQLDADPARADPALADSALADYSKAIELNPEVVRPYFYRGIVRRQHKADYDGAITDFSKVIELNPNSALGYAYRCHTRVDRRDYADAISDCNKALALDPGDAEVYFSRGNARTALTQWGGGIADLTKTIKLNARAASAYNHRAWPYLILNRNDLAYSDAASYLRLVGATSDAASYVVLIAYFAKRQSGEVVAARVLDEWALRITSDKWPYAVIRYLRREISEQEMLGSTTDKEQILESRAYLGMSLWLSGQREAALIHLRWVRENGIQGNYEHAWVTNALRRFEGGLK